jgi:hypothetical protein
VNRRDLEHLDATVLATARAVVAMADVFGGLDSPDVVGMRHDVDDNRGALETAVRLAAWEASRGYRSTYFVLHTARYWETSRFPHALDQIANLGHEIGIHANAVAEALRTGGDPAEILAAAIEQLRRWGHDVVGVAPHGDKACRDESGGLVFVNDEMFAECARPELGAADRYLRLGSRVLKLAPRPLADFGLAFESYRLPHGRYLSDTGGRWNVPPASVATGDGQLHVLQHPDWWAAAFKFRRRG